MEKMDITIIGAGIVGLSITSSVAHPGKNVLLVEKHVKFGQETSSRNSQVIHASIYYPAGFLKGQLCLEGNEMMYKLCSSKNIPHKNLGKLIVAVNEKEEAMLDDLLKMGKANGAKGLEIISGKKVKELEPNVNARAAILCPTSGIVDTHRLMAYWESHAKENGAEIAYGVEVNRIEKTGDGYRVHVIDADGQHFDFFTRILINSAGLNSGNIAAMAGIDIDKAGYHIHYLKGMYFRVGRGKEKMATMLIYPVPPRPGSVGVHTVPELDGGMRLGPYDVWVDQIEYNVDESLRNIFYTEAKSFLPFIELEDLYPDTAGIHPKVQKPDEPMKDFIIAHESQRGLPGLINLIGIESPGVTASPAIGQYVSLMTRTLL